MPHRSKDQKSKIKVPVRVYCARRVSFLVHR